MSSPHAKSVLHRILSGSFATTGYFGLQDLANASFVDEVFPDSLEYDATRRADIVTHYTRNPVSVLFGFPREETAYPCVIIQRVRDSERDGPMGDVFSETRSGGVKTTCKGMRFAETYELYLAVPFSPVQRDEIYEAIKSIFVRARIYFEQQGLRNIMWSNGADGEIEIPRANRPFVLHTASINLDFLTEYTYTETTALQDAATAINSIWINPDTDEGDVTIAKYEDT